MTPSTGSGQVRLPDWEERLHTYLARVAGQPFAWGRHDCALHAANAVLAQTGEDPAAAYRGRYQTARGSVRALRKWGADTLEATIAAGFGEVAPAFARRGDLALIDGPLGVSVGVVVGRDALFVGEAGLERFDRSQWRRCWAVG